MLFTPHLWMPKAAAVVFSGPGDIKAASNWLYWTGVRAFSVAAIGTNAINLRRDSDNTTQDFVTVAGGGLDLASITTFKSTANLFVTKMYDQSGHGFDMAQSATGQQPAFILSRLGSLPGVSLVSGNFNALASGGALNQVQPFSFVAVAKNFSGGNDIAGEAGGTCGLLFSGANQINLFAGSTGALTAADGSWHSAAGTINAASSAMSIDGGVDTGVSCGPNTLSGGIERIGIWSGGWPTIDYMESGIALNLTATDRVNLTSNAKSYYGF